MGRNENFTQIVFNGSVETSQRGGDETSLVHLSHFSQWPKFHFEFWVIAFASCSTSVNDSFNGGVIIGGGFQGHTTYGQGQSGDFICAAYPLVEKLKKLRKPFATIWLMKE